MSTFRIAHVAPDAEMISKISGHVMTPVFPPLNVIMGS